MMWASDVDLILDIMRECLEYLSIIERHVPFLLLLEIMIDIHCVELGSFQQ